MKRVFHRQVASTVAAFVVIVSLAHGTVAPTDALSAKGKLTEEQKIIHLLNRIGFGPRPGDVERVKKIGLEKFLDQQLHPEKIDDSALEPRLKGLDSLNLTIAELYQKYPPPQDIARRLGLTLPAAAPAPARPGEQPNQQQAELRQKLLAYYTEHGLKQPPSLLQELQAQKIIRAVYSERQLEEVMTDFWFNHFNVFWNKGADRWLTTDYEMNAIRPNVLGKFKDLVLATAKSPAMLFYLDNHLSSSPDADRPLRRNIVRPAQPNPLPGLGNRRQERQQERQMERRAEQTDRRMEPQQPAQIGNQLQRRSPGINENYARELMELHTMGVDGGYTQKDVQEVARCFTGWTIDRPQQNGESVFREWMHDNGEKIVLGQKIPAGGGMKDGEKVIDILTHHPSTASFIAAKLVRRFVSDTPSKSLVDRVASVYKKSDGDIREMLRAIFTSKEFYSPEAYRAKVKSPFELVVSAIRALGGDTNGAPRLAQMMARMGQPLYQYQPPTGFPDRAEYWVNTGAVLERFNFAVALTANRIPGTQVDIKRVAAIETVEPNKALDRAIAVLLNNEVSAETRRTVEKQLKENPLQGPREQALLLGAFGYVLGSPEFQRR